MFNSTHTLAGFSIARTGFDGWVPYATVTAVIAANLPDIEILSGLRGTAAYLDNHRGITHTFVGVPVLALILAAVMYYFSGHFWKTFAVSFVAMCTHPVLDYLNTYGVRPFLPFDRTWYYGDLLFIFDPYVDSILLLGLVAGALFNRRRAMAWLSLVLVIGYIGARIELRSLAAGQMEGFIAKTPGIDQWVVFPTMLNPFAWEGIAGTKTEWLKVNVNSLGGVGDEVVRIPRGAANDIVKRASESESGAALLRFARFPTFQVDGLE
ncbi:MAG TPA: metal-dependent hydrolase, partial [Terriglobia bacterium]